MSRDEDKVKRWRLRQFSLHSLLLLILVVASFFGGWKASDWHRERELRRTAAEQLQNQFEFFQSPQKPPVFGQWQEAADEKVDIGPVTIENLDPNVIKSA